MLERKNNLEAIAFLEVIAAEVREGLINHTAQKDKIQKKYTDYKMQKYVADCKLGRKCLSSLQPQTLHCQTHSSLPFGRI